MGIEKMSLISIEGKRDELDAALMVCCESRMFQMTEAAGAGSGVLRNLNEQNPYAPVCAKLHDMVTGLGITPEFTEYSSVKQESGAEFEQRCAELGAVYSKLKGDYDGLLASLDEHKQIAAYILHFKGLNVSFRDLFGLKYVKLRIGRLPAENIRKLDYYTTKCFTFIPFENNGQYVWGIYLAPVSSAEFADAIMNSLFFERTHLPDYLDADAEETEQTLEKIIEDEEKLKQSLETELAYFTENNRTELLAMLSKLKFKSDCFELRKKVLISGERYSFSGYCPTKESKALVEKLGKKGAQALDMPIDRKGASNDVPTLLKNNILTRPFEMFVKMYGLPRYGGLDPTPYVAFTYCLMYGIMFGDLGQGLVISILGFILSKVSKNGLAPIMMRIGLFSAAFGVLYGSVFGIETIITPFFHRENIWRFLGYTEQPHNIFQVATTLLIAALMLGVVFILISIGINTILSFKNMNLGEALFSVNGLCGFVLYSAIVVGAVTTLMFGMNLMTPAYIILLIALPAVLIFFKHPLTNLITHTKPAEKVSVGNFIIENFIEMFEAALSYLSNTMSFLRIGGFIMSHAGMMLVVAQLAGGTEEITVGTVITYIIGNIIVMGVEGLLVGIQVLRLEFYEIFSRFYAGDGHGFTPIDIKFETEN